MSKEIVWLDDDFDLISSLMIRLRQADYKITSRRTVTEALQILDTLQTCTVLVLDIILPLGQSAPVDFSDDEVYTGLKLLQYLQDTRGFDRPVIVCSVVTDNKILNALEKRVKKILYKPEMTATKLKQEVEKAIQTD